MCKDGKCRLKPYAEEFVLLAVMHGRMAACFSNTAHLITLKAVRKDSAILWAFKS
jgi:hypothetical protein